MGEMSDIEKRLEVIEELKLEARYTLDKHSYNVLIEACDNNRGPPELLKCLRSVFESIIEDWIQDYINERELIHKIDTN